MQNVIRVSECPETDLVEYYQGVYEGKIRPVDSNWVKAQKGKYQDCPKYMSNLAYTSKNIFNSYSSAKSVESKRTFVLWKMNSICECLSTYGFGCNYKDCTHCQVHINAQKQLEEIDLGTDVPYNQKAIKAEEKGDRIVFNWKGHHIEVLISENKEENKNEQ